MDFSSPSKIVHKKACFIPFLLMNLLFSTSNKRLSWLRHTCFCSQAYTFGNLNRQLIMLLSALGIKGEVFEEIFNDHYDDLEKMTWMGESAVRVLQWRGKFDLSQRIVRSHSIPNDVRGELYKIQAKLIESSSKVSTVINTHEYYSCCSLLPHLSISSL